jgi:endoglucanase
VISYVAIDGYNWSTTQKWGSEWESFEEIFAESIKKALSVSWHKPLMIGEFASTDVGGNKAEWIRDAMKAIKGLPVESFVWFDIKKEQDWRIDSDPSCAQEFSNAVKDPHFIPGSGEGYIGI